METKANKPTVWSGFSPLAVLLALALCAAVPGCDALNPAFVDFASTNFDGIDVQPQGPTSPGHVVIAFRNDTVFDEALLQSLINAGLDPALTEVEGLRPRVRILVRVTFVNGEQIQLEFNDGSSTIVHPAVDVLNFPDLTRTGRNNLVVQCDVARVELVTLPSVFVPLFFETIRIDDGDDDTDPFRVQVDTAPPQFVTLREDDTDQFGNTLTLRNVDVRDRPAPAVGPNCGSVVTITIAGTLRAPFEINEFGALVPGVLNTNFRGIAAHPGRFSINVGIR